MVYKESIPEKIDNHQIDRSRSARELADRLNRMLGVEYREQLDYWGTDVRQLDFTESDLSNADFTEANLSNLDMTVADFSSKLNGNVVLLGSQRMGKTFTRANCQGTNFSGCDLSEADFYQAVCTNANFSSSNLVYVCFQEAELEYTILRGSHCYKTKFSRSRMQGVNASECIMFRAAFLGCNLTGANLSSCDLRNADLRKADCREARLAGADLSGADLRDAILVNADLTGADLTNADTRGADFTDANLCGIRGDIQP